MRKVEVEEEKKTEKQRADGIDLIQQEESQTQAEKDKKARESEESHKDPVTAATREPDDRQLVEVDSESKSPGVSEPKRHEGMII